LACTLSSASAGCQIQGQGWVVEAEGKEVEARLRHGDRDYNAAPSNCT